MRSSGSGSNNRKRGKQGSMFACPAECGGAITLGPCPDYVRVSCTCNKLSIIDGVAGVLEGEQPLKFRTH